MNYGSYCFYMLVLTSLTGSIFYLLWMLLRILLKRYRFIWNERFFCFLQMTFLVPVLFIGLLVYHQDMTLLFVVTDTVTDALFIATQTTLTVVGIFFVLWGIGVGVYLILQIRGLVFIHNLLRSAVPADDPQMLKLFTEVKETLGIDTEICLLQNDLLDTPIATGLVHPCVIMPFHMDTGDSLRPVLMHELLHIRHRHMWLKLLMVPLQLLNVLNPIAHLFRRTLHLELEKLCDRRIYSCLDGDKDNAIADYYQLMFNGVAGGIANKEMESAGFPLFRTKSDLQRRITDMREYKNARAVRKSVAVLLTLCLLFGSSLTVFAAGEGVVMVHQVWYDATKVLIPESAVGNTLEEQPFTADMWDEFTVVIMQEDGTETITTVKTINWSVSANGGTRSTPFYLHTGDQVSANVSITPNNLTVRMGLDYPNGNGAYVSGSGVLTHVFTAPMDGYYDFFVINSNSVAVTANGNYIHP